MLVALRGEVGKVAWRARLLTQSSPHRSGPRRFFQVRASLMPGFAGAVCPQLQRAGCGSVARAERQPQRAAYGSPIAAHADYTAAR